MRIDYWRTYDNRVIKASEISHQHLSNIYYFTTYIVPQLYPQSIRDWVERQLFVRFEGKKLPYSPCPEFTNEIVYLKRNGFLKINGDIVVNGEKIGKFVDLLIQN